MRQEEALEIGDHDAAVAHLQAARKIIRAKMTKIKREEAALVAEEARVEENRLNYPEAARLFEEAASLLPVEDRAERWHHLLPPPTLGIVRGMNSVTMKPS